MAKLTLDQLERHLFAAADILRGTMDAAEYRDFLLVLLFLKRANDEFDAAHDEIIAEEMASGATREEAEEEADAPNRYTARRVIYVPADARWKRLDGAVNDVAGKYLQPALDALEGQKGNERLRGLFGRVNFNRIGGGGGTGTSAANLADTRLAALIGHFGTLRLRGEDFEFPDVIGAAYEYLLKDFADTAGAKGGEFYTPRAVVRMMVELARPQANQRVYDPCVGSGGMLIHAKEYIEEDGGDTEDLALAGQDANDGSWVMATMNMLFHGASDFDLKIGDTLTNPLHLDKSYDLVLSNPPFSMDYRATDILDLEDRMPYGRTSEKGKADLMFLQHMLHMVEGRGGSVFTVMPHGVLFRSGAEGDIRTRLIEDDLLEAVIGLPSNIFYGTGIPACVLVLRAKGRKHVDRHDQVLFINADREFHSERAQNVLLPEHVEKIVSTFHAAAGEDVPRFARWVKHSELKKNAYNLNIRRYVDNTPPPEPQDVRAHLTGGVPRSEITADEKAKLLGAYRIGVTDLFAERPADADGTESAYVDFLPEDRRPDAERLAALAEGRERELWESFDKWWAVETEQIASLAPHEGDDRTEFEKRSQLARLRVDLIHSFRELLLGVGLLDRYALAGAVAGWWQDARNELKALSGNGFKGVVEGWVDTVETLLEPEPNPWTGGARKRSSAERRQAYGHKVVARIAPDFLRELAEADKLKAKLNLKVKAAEEAEAARAAAAAGVAEDGDASEEATGLDPAVAEALLSPADLKKAKRERTAAGKAVKALEEAFYPLDGMGGGAKAVSGAAKKKAEAAESASAEQTALDVAVVDAEEERPTPGLHEVRDALTEEGARGIVLGILRDDLASTLEGHVVRRRRELIDTYLGWEHKYLVSLRDIETRRTAAVKRLEGFLEELGYVG
ncbi:class I SAM-dependent DNA methyltransferase [Streptomyces sp. ADI93-02]|uniref:type I restriction-modification system subunit M n=1 Tax=unclassified Streptomyces TaxID=2593676 RepID=UPI000F55125C|nr:class I SAM-dependent DNA methyltransferase [Streptomyces sp. ADI93-02]RPK39866.1 putative type I restriction enzymeP M protein [Streptomyces sp. ADI93-02]WSS76810.1 type I restriction-modification system subunit M [Streptomyces sp. NBC_01174]